MWIFASPAELTSPINTSFDPELPLEESPVGLSICLGKPYGMFFAQMGILLVGTAITRLIFREGGQKRYSEEFGRGIFVLICYR